MTKPKQLTTIAILMSGDMGHGCGFVFRENGFHVIAYLAGRSQRPINLAKRAGIEILSSLETRF